MVGSQCVYHYTDQDELNSYVYTYIFLFSNHRKQPNKQTGIFN